MSIRGALFVAALAMAGPAWAQHDHNASGSSNADITQCLQAQTVVSEMLSDAAARVEAARQTNSSSVMRAAIDDMNALTRNLRSQIAPCARMQPVAASVAEAKPPLPSAAAPLPTPTPAEPVTPAPPTAAQAAEPAPASAVHEHAGPTAPAVTTAAAAVPADPQPLTPAPAPVPAPVAVAPPPSATVPETHTDHQASSTVAAPASAGVAKAAAPPRAAAPTVTRKPAPASLPAATPRFWATRLEDLRCTTGVAGSGSPRTTYQGTTYFFCTEHDRLNFLRNPTAAISGR